MTENPKSSVLLPLYIYPDPGAWEPIHAAYVNLLHRRAYRLQNLSSIAANPTLNFVVIVNPNSGPGAPPWWPNADYVREIPKLNAQPNVQTVGYVRTAYCERSIEKVFEDIETYANWSKDSTSAGLSVEGIFFDETQNVYSEEVKAFLDAITQRVRNTSGILGDKLVGYKCTSGKVEYITSIQVIHNPGTAVDRRLADPGPDITTVVEEAYARYQTPEYQQWMSTSPYDRSRSSFMVHTVPIKQVHLLICELRHRAGYLFVTDLTANYYQSFGTSWDIFVAAMAVE